VTWNDKAYNLRDLGGLPTEDGRKTRSGLLYRSATLHDLGVEGAAVLRHGWGVCSVVDLRTPEEIAAQGATTAATWGARCLGLPVLPPPLPEDGGPADLLSRYFVYLERSTPNVVAVLRHVSCAVPPPVAIHCTSGKDRTGVVTALLLRLVGVTREAVVGDYAATAANIASVMERLGRSAGLPPGKPGRCATAWKRRPSPHCGARCCRASAGPASSWSARCRGRSRRRCGRPLRR
jgi:protein-tyrosine phosphatase